MPDPDTPKRILVVDDSRLILKLAQTTLGQRGFSVLTATNLDDVSETLRQEGPPDLVLLDVQMPSMDGDDMAVYMQREWDLKAPILLFSDIPEEQLKSRTEAVGVLGYVSKHWGLEKLGAEVERYLADLEDGQQAGSAGVEALPASAIAIDTVLLIDDSGLILQMAAEALRRSGYTVVTADSFDALPERLMGLGGDPALILIDINMPDIQGDDLLVFLRERWKIQSPIMLFSNLPREELEFRAQTVGADGFISKHWGLDRMVEVVTGILHPS